MKLGSDSSSIWDHKLQYEHLGSYLRIYFEKEDNGFKIVFVFKKNSMLS